MNKEWMKKLSDEEKKSIETISSAKECYTYSDKFGTHYVIKSGVIVLKGKEVEVFKSGDFAITENFDTWKLYRDDEILCEGVWVLSHKDKSYTFKYYNDTIGKYIVESVAADGTKNDEIEVNEDTGHTKTDYMNFV